jgi:diacylglycerol kinase
VVNPTFDDGLGCARGIGSAAVLYAVVIAVLWWLA